MTELLDTLLNGPARWAESQELGPGMTLVVVLGVLAAEIGAVWMLLQFLLFLALRVVPLYGWVLRKFSVGVNDLEYVFLQLTFPSSTTKSAYATEQLHILLRSIVGHYGFWDKLAAWKRPYSLELVATKDEGIRYMIRVPVDEAEHVRRTILSYLPGIRISEIDDYAPDDFSANGSDGGNFTVVNELKLSNDYILPLETNKTLTEHDPIAYITGHMRKTEVDELAALQIVAIPVFKRTHPHVVRRMRDMRHRIALNKTLSDKLTEHNIDVGGILFRMVILPFYLIAQGARFVGGVINMFIHDEVPGGGSGDKRPADDPYEKELRDTVKTKLDQHSYEISIRIVVSSPDEYSARSRLDALVSSFETLSSSWQSLRRRKPSVPLPVAKKRMYAASLARFQTRELSRHIFSQPTIVSASELADLYHFPNTNLTKTEDLVKSRSKDLPVPLSQKRSDTELDVVVGQNEFDGDSQDIGLTLKQRQKHTYVIGKTGTGKTTMLMNAIYQDMVNGKGVAVLDPHGDMFRELLSIVPEHRRKDVVVFDPSDRAHPIGLNILDPGIDFTDEDDKHEWITSSVLSVFAKLSDEKNWGPRMEHILRNTTLTALQTEKPSLYTLQRLLTDKTYQKKIAKTLDDPVLKQFWDKEFKLLGSMQMSSATAPLTHRLGHFITAKMSRHILLQETSTLRIADIMDGGKILLANLSKGDIGEDQSFFFGTILSSFIWMAAYQRTKIPEKDRKDFFVYVDEFQNFATPQFGAITSEGRKFHIGLTLSHQSIAQIKDKDLLKEISGNAATIISLKVGPEDEAFILPHMKPEVEKGDIVNLAPYDFYMKVSGDESEDAFSGRTVELDVEGSDEAKDEVIKNSRKQYATPKADVEKYLEELMSSKKAEKRPKPKDDKAPSTKSEKQPSKKVLHGV